MAEKKSQENRQKKKSSLKKYIRIDFKTLQGRITIGFLLMGAFAIIMLISSNQSWKKQVNKGKELIALNKNSSRIAAEIQQLVYLTTILSFRYISTEDDFFKNDIENRWYNDIYPKVEKLDSLVREFGDEEVITFTEELNAHLPKIKSKQKEALSDLNYDKLNGEDVIDDIMHLTFIINSIKGELAEAEEKAIQNIEEAESSIPLILTIEFIIAFIISTAIALYIIRSVLLRIKYLKVNIRDLAHGNLPKEMKESEDELNSIIKALNELTRNLTGITRFADEVGKGDFSTDITVFDNEGHLGQSLADMRIKLQNVAQQDKRRVWFNEGIAKFGDILRKNDDNIEDLSAKLISELAEYTNSIQGSIFIVNKEDQENIKIVLKGAYAYHRKKFLEKELSPGQGLVGQCYLEKEFIYLSEIPENYVSIRSGLGEANPTHVLISPMKLNEEVFGIIELASFQPYEDYHNEFIEKVGESIASTIQGLQVSLETKKLLEESQMKAEQLQAQEEEMRQNAEELEATQEEMERQSREMGAFNQAVSISTMVAEFDKDGKILEINSQIEFQTSWDSEDLIGLDRKKLFIDEEDVDWSKTWNDVTDHMSMSKSATLMDKQGHELPVVAHFMPVSDEHGNAIKIACIFIKKDKF
ncbi:PAS domain S-box-containing protein [Marivirga sericea]|uniref:PAS domain S-box-containing protein n=1 Tax=Marivirga sericea TaxID=1028 RepID=A0A1X7IPX3_9BACT|nr:GAF domain-containing protein [Marivirga sericea]SMG17158.1 PAS domain S-box-containing protein [Marivirga sericea]